ncbi:MAG: DUF6599 family protein, partial [Acidobacteriaceae bacterium]
MGLGFGTRRGVVLAGLLAGLGVGFSGAAVGQSVTLMEPSAPLLPAKFGEWKRTGTVGAAGAATGTATGTAAGRAAGTVAGSAAGSAAGAAGGDALANLSPQALAECGEKRSQVAEYVRGGRVMHVEAVEFGDKTGAYSAFTLAERLGMTVGTELGDHDAVGTELGGGEEVLFTVGRTVALASFKSAGAGGGTALDVRAMRALAEAMPKVFGNSGLAPMLPTL